MTLKSQSKNVVNVRKWFHYQGPLGSILLWHTASLLRCFMMEVLRLCWIDDLVCVVVLRLWTVGPMIVGGADCIGGIKEWRRLAQCESHRGMLAKMEQASNVIQRDIEFAAILNTQWLGGLSHTADATRDINGYQTMRLDMKECWSNNLQCGR